MEFFLTTKPQRPILMVSKRVILFHPLTNFDITFETFYGSSQNGRCLSSVLAGSIKATANFCNSVKSPFSKLIFIFYDFLIFRSWLLPYFFLFFSERSGGSIIIPIIVVSLQLYMPVLSD